MGFDAIVADMASEAAMRDSARGPKTDAAINTCLSKSRF